MSLFMVSTLDFALRGPGLLLCVLGQWQTPYFHNALILFSPSNDLMNS